MISCSLKTLKSLSVYLGTQFFFVFLALILNKLGENSNESGTVSSPRRFSKASMQKYAGDSLRQSFAGKSGDLKCVRVGKTEDGGVLPVGRSWSRAHVASAEQQVRKMFSCWFLGCT